MTDTPLLATTKERYCYWVRIQRGWTLNGVVSRPAPIQARDETDVPWEVSAEAWKEYAAQGHGAQSHERLCERGGYGVSELAILLYDRIKRLEAALATGKEGA